MKANGQSPYEYPRSLSNDTGVDLGDLVVMNNDNDPFYIGSPAQHAIEPSVTPLGDQPKTGER
jgi:hypothetical protein